MLKEHLQKLKANPALLFGPDYEALYQQGKHFVFVSFFLFIPPANNNWADLLPSLDDLPEDWPGTGLESGLNDTHLAPTCKSIYYLFILDLFLTSVQIGRQCTRDRRAISLVAKRVPNILV